MCNKQEEYLDHVLNQLIRNTKINFPRRTMELPWFHQHKVGCEFVTDISLQNFIASGFIISCRVYYVLDDKEIVELWCRYIMALQDRLNSKHQVFKYIKFPSNKSSYLTSYKKKIYCLSSY